MTDTPDIKWNYSSYTDKMGRTYIISYYNKWDPIKKQSRVAKRVHVGRLNASKSKDSKDEVKTKRQVKKNKKENKLEELKAKLQKEIKAEEFEKAAITRDEIKKLEKEGNK